MSVKSWLKFLATAEKTAKNLRLLFFAAPCNCQFLQPNVLHSCFLQFYAMKTVWKLKYNALFKPYNFIPFNKKCSSRIGMTQNDIYAFRRLASTSFLAACFCFWAYIRISWNGIQQTRWRHVNTQHNGLSITAQDCLEIVPQNQSINQSTILQCV